MKRSNERTTTKVPFEKVAITLSSCVKNLFHFEVSSLDGASDWHESEREREWAARSIAESYWNNRDHPSKHFLVERIATFSPFFNILEVGCASGPNLYPLAKKFPQAQIVGIDINPGAIK